MTGAEFAGWTGGVLALLGVLGVLVKILMVGHRAANRLERIENLAMELEHNGGGSIKDAVHRIDRTVGEMKDVLEEHETRISKNEGRVEAIALVTSPTMLVEDDEGRLRESR